jgi:hypothetical protein
MCWKGDDSSRESTKSSDVNSCCIRLGWSIALRDLWPSYRDQLFWINWPTSDWFPIFPPTPSLGAIFDLNKSTTTTFCTWQCHALSFCLDLLMCNHGAILEFSSRTYFYQIDGTRITVKFKSQYLLNFLQELQCHFQPIFIISWHCKTVLISCCKQALESLVDAVINVAAL